MIVSEIKVDSSLDFGTCFHRSEIIKKNMERKKKRMLCFMGQTVCALLFLWVVSPTTICSLLRSPKDILE